MKKLVLAIMSIVLVLSAFPQAYQTTYSSPSYTATYQGSTQYSQPSYRIYEGTDPCLTCQGCLPSANSPTVFPLVWEIFEATRVSAKEVRLSWTLEVEGETERVQLQRRLDSQQVYVSVANFGDRGLSRIHQDTNAHAGLSYYRLKVIDLDGTLSYTDIRQVGPWQGALEVQIFPNPFDNQLHIQLSQPLRGGGTFQLVDMNGRVLFSQKLTDTAQTLSIQSDLPPGMYLAQIVSPHGRFQQRLIRR